VEPYRLRLLGAIVAMFGVLACTLALPLLMKSAIDSAIIPRDTHLLVIIAGVVIGVGIVGIALSRVETYLTGWVGERVLNDLRVDLFQHMQSLSMGYFEKQRTGILISRLTNDVEALQQLVTDGLTSTVRNVMSLVVAGTILLFLDFRLAYFGAQAAALFDGMLIDAGGYGDWKNISAARNRARGCHAGGRSP
jgi:ATP-binding cassette subfamily B protein